MNVLCGGIPGPHASTRLNFLPFSESTPTRSVLLPTRFSLSAVFLPPIPQAWPTNSYSSSGPWSQVASSRKPPWALCALTAPGPPQLWQALHCISCLLRFLSLLPGHEILKLHLKVFVNSLPPAITQ